MPGDGLTHGPPATKKTQAAVTTGLAGSTGIPCAMVLTAITRSPRSAGLDSLRRPATRLAELDPSVGRSGPRAFTVRAGALRLARRHVHRIPHPTSVTIAIRPSRWVRMAAVIP
jgi:hypothetical protein